MFIISAHKITTGIDFLFYSLTTFQSLGTNYSLNPWIPVTLKQITHRTPPIIISMNSAY